MNTEQKLYPVARSCFSAWERDDGVNQIWDKIVAAYPPDEHGISRLPPKVTLDNVTIDSEGGSIFCLKPLPEKMETIILHVRGK